MTTKAQILRSIRKHCMACSCGSRGEVARCHLQACSLHPYRFGKDPTPSTRQSLQKPTLHKGSFEHGEGKVMVMKEEAPVKCVNTTRGKTSTPSHSNYGASV